MNSTYVVGVGALILTGVFYTQAENLPSVAKQLPMPLIMIVAILAVLMILEEALKQRREQKQSSTQTTQKSDVHDSDGEAPLDPINWRVFVSFLLALLAYIWLIPILGYVITTAAFIVGVLLCSKTIKPVTSLLIALGFTAFVWLVFVWALGLPVPLLPWLD